MESKNKVTVLLIIAIVAATLAAVSYISDNRSCNGTACVTPTPVPIMTVSPTPVPTFNPAYGFLSVSSFPTGAEITVSGGHYGITNRDGTNPVPGQPGSYISVAPKTYTVVVSKTGYKPVTDTVAVTAGTMVRRSYTLVPN